MNVDNNLNPDTGQEVSENPDIQSSQSSQNEILEQLASCEEIPELFIKVRKAVNKILTENKQIRKLLDSFEGRTESIMEAVRLNKFELLAKKTTEEEFNCILGITTVKNRMIADLINNALEQKKNKFGLSRDEQLLLKGTLKMVSAFDNLYIRWRENLYPKNFHEKFKNKSTKNIQKFLKKQNLDDPYAVVAENTDEANGKKYKSIPYPKAFREETAEIIENIDKIVNSSENPPQEMIAYLEALKKALTCEESRKENGEWLSIKLWKKVDEKWMLWNNKIQMIHMIEEGYDPIDLSNKKIIPEFKIMFESTKSPEIMKMINKMVKENTEALRELLNKYRDDQTGLAIHENSKVFPCVPVSGGGLSMQFFGVAQVAPNYGDVAEKHGTKSFLDAQSLSESEDLLDTIAQHIFGKETFNKNLIHITDDESRNRYLIDYIGSHETGHTLLGNFCVPDIEEAKATWSGMVGLWERTKKSQISKETADNIMKSHVKTCLSYLIEFDRRKTKQTDYFNEGSANVNLFLETGLLRKENDQWIFDPKKINDTYIKIQEIWLKFIDMYIEAGEYNNFIKTLITPKVQTQELILKAKRGKAVYNLKQKTSTKSH